MENNPVMFQEHHQPVKFTIEYYRYIYYKSSYDSVEKKPIDIFSPVGNLKNRWVDIFYTSQV